jgi:hypothetical protein
MCKELIVNVCGLKEESLMRGEIEAVEEGEVFICYHLRFAIMQLGMIYRGMGTEGVASSWSKKALGIVEKAGEI